MHTTFARRAVPVVVNAAVMAGCLFGAAGRMRWPHAWVLIGLSTVLALAAEAVVARSPGLADERANVRAGRSWDKALVLAVGFLGPVATWITAGLEARHGGWAGLPTWASAAGVIIALCGGAVLVWAMHANRYFSAVVRIQKERGHSVATGGPYGFVRHPGYAGVSAFMLATPFILDSRWALIPAAVTVGLNVVRTSLEDRLLRAELPGYPDYARSVRFRLVPGVW